MSKQETIEVGDLVRVGGCVHPDWKNQYLGIYLIVHINYQHTNSYYGEFFLAVPNGVEPFLGRHLELVSKRPR